MVCRQTHCRFLQVRFAAALTVTALAISNAKASAILEDALVNGAADERWQAARCLASLGVGTVEVVKELLSHLVPPKDDVPNYRNEAIVQLQTVSKSTTLVRSLVSLSSFQCGSVFAGS